jgi:hypothetical protein
LALEEGRDGMAMPRTADTGFDVAVVDRDNRAVALVQVKAHPVRRRETILPTQLPNFAESVAFVLTIDPNRIHLYTPVGESLGEPIVQLDTRQVLQHYDPEFSKKRVFEPYLLTLVEASLRDLAYHWKSEDPPTSEELGRAGLLEKLEGGTTQRLGA